MLRGGIIVTRLELLSIMYALKRMCVKRDFEGVELVVDKIISEGESGSEKKSSEKRSTKKKIEKEES